MIRTFAALLLATLASSLQAATPQIFPDDYKHTDCDIKSLCGSWKRTELTMAGARMQSYTHMSEQWIDAHWDQLIGELKPYCAKLAACYATPGNTNMFCNDVVLTQSMSICDQFTDKKDYEQCFLMMRTYVSGIDLNSWKPWDEAKECIKANPPAPGLRHFELTMTPKTIPPDFDGKLVIYALDKETHIPVKSAITIDDEILYSKDVPDGTPTTSYPLPWKAKLIRVKAANGHEELVAPMVKIEREGYETVTFRMPIDIHPMDVTMTPSLSQLKPGKNTVTITAKDPTTGKPVDARVLIGMRDVAYAGQPFELDIKKGARREEIWVRSPWDRYNDTVVAPATR
jgi:hypothetical protein